MVRTKKERRRGPHHGSKIFTVQGEPWVYRQPYEQDGRWRVRRRHRLSGEVTLVTLDAQSLTAAKDEVVRLAAKETRQAEEREKNPQGLEQTDIELGKALDLWLKTTDVRSNTQEKYESYVKAYKALLGENRIVREITYADIEGLFIDGGRWADKSGRTKILHRGILARIWRWLLKRGYSQVNVPEMIEIPKTWSKAARKAARETGQALSREEAQRLLDACREPFVLDFTPKAKRASRKEAKFARVTPPPFLWWITFVSLRTGLRIGNVIGTENKPPLNWGMADLEKGVLFIEGRWMKNDTDFIVPMNEELIEKLRDLAVSRDQIPSKQEPIIPGLHEAVRVSLRKMFNAALKRANLGDRDFRIHDLRHTFVSWLGQRCVHSVMQKLAGHTPSNITDLYGHHQDIETLRKGINSLPRLLGPTEPQKARAESAL